MKNSIRPLTVSLIGLVLNESFVEKKFYNQSMKSARADNAPEPLVQFMEKVEAMADDEILVSELKPEKEHNDEAVAFIHKRILEGNVHLISIGWYFNKFESEEAKQILVDAEANGNVAPECQFQTYVLYSSAGMSALSKVAPEFVQEIRDLRNQQRNSMDIGQMLQSMVAGR